MAPPSLHGESSDCPKCGGDVAAWPAPVRRASSTPTSAPVPPSASSPPPLLFEVVDEESRPVPAKAPEADGAQAPPPRPKKRVRDEERDDEEDDRPSRRKPKAGTQPWVWVAAGVGGLVVLALVSLAALSSAGVFRAGSETASSTPKGAEGAAAGDSAAASSTAKGAKIAAAEEYETYVESLKKRVSFGVPQFKQSGMTAESYTKDPNDEDLFIELTVQIEPVYIRDSLTKQTKLYTRARLVRNNPTPVRMTRPGTLSHIPEPYAWAKVEMLP